MEYGKFTRFFGVDRLFDSISSYMEARIRLLKLEMGELVAESSVKIMEILAVGILISLGLFFMSIAAGIFLGEVFDNYGLGFLCIGGFYSLLGLILYLTWDKLGLKEKIYNYLAQKLESEIKEESEDE